MRWLRIYGRITCVRFRLRAFLPFFVMATMLEDGPNNASRVQEFDARNGCLTLSSNKHLVS